MKRGVLLATLVALIIGPALPASAEDRVDDLESMSLGDPHGQNGWSSVGTGTSRGGSYNYDHYIVDPSAYATNPAGFGSRALRMSNARIQNSFGEQVISAPLVDEAGEMDAINGGYSGGLRQRAFRFRFDVVSTMATQQPGMAIGASPDRGDGARMSLVTVEDGTTGLDVKFTQFVAAGGNCAAATFSTATVASGLGRTTPHRIGLEVVASEGSANDEVTLTIDGVEVATGQSWEDYYRCQTPSGSRTMDSILIRSVGTEVPANRGNGFLLDNFYYASGAPSGTAATWCVPTIAIDPSCDAAEATIPEAVISASTGDTILLDGTYTLASPIVIAEDGLTIRSVDGDATLGGGATLRLTGSNPPGDGIIRLMGSDNSIIGLAFEDHTDVPGGPDPDHVSLKIEGDDTLVSKSRFVEPLVFTAGEPCQGGDYDIQIRAESGDGVASGTVIDSNLFEGGCRAIAAVYSGETRRADDTTITGNTISGPGIGLDGGGRATISNNHLLSSLPMSGSGIYCRSKDAPLGSEPNHTVSGTTLTGNIIEGYAHGAYFQGCGGVTSTENIFRENDRGVTIVSDAANTGAPVFHRDSFYGNLTSGLSNATGELVYAERSWWGHQSGPSGAGGGSGDAVSVDVSYSPWYLDAALTTLAPFDRVIDCSTRSNDVAAIQAVLDEMHSGGTLALDGVCDLTSVGPYTLDPTKPHAPSIDAAALAVSRPDVTITSFDLASPATLLGSGTQAGIYIAPGTTDTVISGLLFVNLARGVVAHNTARTKVGPSTALLSPLGNRFEGGASTDAAVLGIGSVSGPSVTVAIGAQGSPRTYPTPASQKLEDLEVHGNVMRIDPPGPRAHGIDIRQANQGFVEGVYAKGNSIGMGGTEFASTVQAGIHVWGHAGSGGCFLNDVNIDGNLLGRFEELSGAGLGDLQAAGRTGMLFHNVCGFNITDNFVRARLSPTPGLDTPGGGIVVDNSNDGKIAGGAILVLDDVSSKPANAGAIAVLRGFGSLLGGSGLGPATHDIDIFTVTVGTITDGGAPTPQSKGLTVNGASRINAWNIDFEAVSERAIWIGREVKGQLASLPAAAVSNSSFCANWNTASDGTQTVLAANRVGFQLGVGSTANMFPGGQFYTGNSSC